MTNSSIFHPWSCCFGLRWPAELSHPIWRGWQPVDVVYSLILICSNFLETSNEVDDIRGWFKRDVVRLSEREEGGETKPLVDSSVLFRLGKANRRTYTPAHGKQKTYTCTSSLCLNLECDWLFKRNGCCLLIWTPETTKGIQSEGLIPTLDCKID